MPYINIAKNTYLLPRVSYKIIGDVKDDHYVTYTRDTQEFRAGLGFYVLF